MRPFALLVLVLLATAAQAQDARRRIVLTDGAVIVGVVQDETADPVVVFTEGGVEQRVPRARIDRIEALPGNGRFTRVDPTRTRLVFSPTGRTMGRAGQVRLGVLSVVIPNVTYAVSDRVDLGGAGVIAIGSGGAGVLVPGAKVQVLATDGAAIALGVSAVIPITSDSDANGAFIASPYLAATFGDETRAVTLGVAGFFGGDVSTGDFEAANGVLLSGGGELQVSNSVKLLGEVIVPVGEGSSAVILLPGVRFFGDRFSADLFGFVGSAEGEVAGFAPLASFTYNF